MGAGSAFLPPTQEVSDLLLDPAQVRHALRLPDPLAGNRSGDHAVTPVSPRPAEVELEGFAHHLHPEPIIDEHPQAFVSRPIPFALVVDLDRDPGLPVRTAEVDSPEGQIGLIAPTPNDLTLANRFIRSDDVDLHGSPPKLKLSHSCGSVNPDS